MHMYSARNMAHQNKMAEPNSYEVVKKLKGWDLMGRACKNKKK